MTYEEELSKIAQLKKDYLQTFNTDAGQRVLEDLKKRFFWYVPTYSSRDGETQLNEGGRKVLLTIQSIMELPIKELKKELGKV